MSCRRTYVLNNKTRTKVLHKNVSHCFLMLSFLEIFSKISSQQKKFMTKFFKSLKKNLRLKYFYKLKKIKFQTKVTFKEKRIFKHKSDLI